MFWDPFWAIFRAKCARESDSVLQLGDEIWSAVRGRVLGSVAGSFKCKVCTGIGLGFPTRQCDLEEVSGTFLGSS